jgi:putative ABC transport system substrate-binding protein
MTHALSRTARCALALALLTSTAALAQDAPAKTIAVVTDDDLPLYRTVVTGVGVEALGRVVTFSLGGDAAAGEPVFAQVKAASPDLVIAVGPKAANAAKAVMGQVPVVHSMVPRLESYDLGGQKVAGVRLERSYAAQLAALKALLPEAKKVAVLYNPARSGKSIQVARKAAAEADLELVAVGIGAPDEAKAALEGLKGQAQALWMISDPTVLNVATVESMIAFTTQEKLPFFALNASFVERGALFAFAVDYARLGRQVGRVANRILHEGADPGQLGVLNPEGIDVALNLKAARAVGEGDGLAIAVMSYAAKNRHGVLVFE